MRGSSEVWFATSNPHKFREARYALSAFPIRLRRIGIKGTEVQSEDVAEVASRAAAEAYARSGRRLFVEDTGLYVRSLGGFPGPYASYVEKTVGHAALLLLMQGEQDREAEFTSAVAYCDSRSGVRVFRGTLKGTIALKESGKGGFGFDPLFMPAGERRTLAQMSLEEKSALSHRALALRSFGTWFAKNSSG